MREMFSHTHSGLFPQGKGSCGKDIGIRMKKESIQTYSYRISQASPTELVVIMYDMIAEYLADAVTALHLPDIDEFRQNIKLAKRVIDELVSGLDMQYEISGQLFQVYGVMSRFLIRASAGRDETLVQSVIRMIQMLRKSFAELSKEDKSGPVMRNTQQVYAGLTYSNAGGSNEFSNDPISNRGYTV